MFRTNLLVPTAVVLIAAGMLAQEPEPSKPAAAPQAATQAEAAKPLPEPGKLIDLARAHSETWRAIQKNYISKETVVADEFDSHGTKKGTHTDEYRVFFVARFEIQQHITHDGKPLSPSDEAKEQDRVNKAVAKAKQKGEDPDKNPAPPPRLAMLLKVTTLSNERRETINGRPTIIFDYAGNPKARRSEHHRKHHEAPHRPHLDRRG